MKFFTQLDINPFLPLTVSIISDEFRRIYFQSDGDEEQYWRYLVFQLYCNECSKNTLLTPIVYQEIFE